MVELLKHLKINLCGNIIRCELRVIIGIDIKEKCQDIIFSITLVVTIFVQSLFFLVTDDVRRFPRRRENGKRRKRSYLMSILPPETEC